MADYDLYYWSVPFRGQFVRALLAYTEKTWTEADNEAIYKLIEQPAKKMPVPFKGPPLLIDKKRPMWPLRRYRPSFFIWARRWISCPPRLCCAP